MENSFKKIAILLTCMTVAGCGSHWSREHNEGYTTKTESKTAIATASEGEDIGGSIRRSMDKFDQDKLARALDKAPGKTTAWENKLSGIHYAVVPTRVTKINGNPYCRHYNVTATTTVNNNTREMNGTACVDGGTWKSVNAD